MTRRTRLALVASLLLVGACTTVPTGPNVLVLPGTGKNFDQFRFDDNECRQFATQQVGTSAENAQVDSGVKSAAIGAGVGALAGAIADGSRGAGGGAAIGLLFGAVAGAGSANASGHNVQRRYDMSYQQCMYTKGHRVPVAGRVDRGSPPAYQQYAPQPAQPSVIPPPPPPGNPPPPPRS
jgi:outer membrane lipoprotein SlyB